MLTKPIPGIHRSLKESKYLQWSVSTPQISAAASLPGLRTLVEGPGGTWWIVVVRHLHLRGPNLWCANWNWAWRTCLVSKGPCRFCLKRFGHGDWKHKCLFCKIAMFETRNLWEVWSMVNCALFVTFKTVPKTRWCHNIAVNCYSTNKGLHCLHNNLYYIPFWYSPD